MWRGLVSKKSFKEQYYQRDRDSKKGRRLLTVGDVFNHTNFMLMDELDQYNDETYQYLIEEFENRP